MAQEMSPALYAAHAGIPESTVDDWIQGRGSVLFDPRDLRQIHGRLSLIAVAAPNGAGLGARPRFIPNPNYKYERKRKPKASVHVTTGAGPMDVIAVQGAGVEGMAQPAPEHVQGDASFGVVGGEGMPQGFQVADRKAGPAHA
jgi:hypothetical protein